MAPNKGSVRRGCIGCMILNVLIIAMPFLLLSVSMGSVDSRAEDVKLFRTDPASISVTVNEGQPVNKEFTLTNIADHNVTGELQSVGVKCASQSPSISITSDEKINLQPNQSIVVKLKIIGASSGGDECMNVHVQFVPDKSMGLGEYVNIEVMTVEVHTRPGLGVLLSPEYCILDIALIILVPVVLIIIVWRWRKSRKARK